MIPFIEIFLKDIDPLINAQINKLSTRNKRSITPFQKAKYTKEILFLKDRLNNILSKNTGQTVKSIENDTNRDNFMSAKEAIKYGLIDEIVNKD